MDAIAGLRKHYKDISEAKAEIYRRFARFFWNEQKINDLINLDSDLELVLSSISSYYEKQALETISGLRDKVEALEAKLIEAKKAAHEAKPKPTAKRKKI
jgi:hypothetical protein